MSATHSVTIVACTTVVSLGAITMFERCIYFNVNSLARTLNRLWDRAYAPLGLTAPQAYVLRAVLNHYGLNHQVLAGELNLEKSTVSRIVDQLEQKGLVIRKHDDASDARLVTVTPTPQAFGIHADIENIETSLYRQVGASVGADALKELLTELRQLHQSLHLE
ncbi:MAG: MarR family winged helix-turn-helix transcriptional regulator [Gammaproteobacteria bacterium]|nr:MarR family winged helix-turn-helix transcriptional regulator [Gammaproteobacteria bacterium]